MIEKEAAVRVFNETLGAKGNKAKLVRVAPDGFYEVILESQGRAYTTLLPIHSTVIMALEPEQEFAPIEVER